MNIRCYKVSLRDLERIVTEDNKTRYSFNDSKTKIRTNQGHSIPVELSLKEAVPQNFLYHGTASKFVKGILNEGIKKRSRNHVHLSENISTAANVGSRHGYAVILKINTAEMVKDGFRFFLSKNNIWLTDFVPVKYIEIINR